MSSSKDTLNRIDANTKTRLLDLINFFARSPHLGIHLPSIASQHLSSTTQLQQQQQQQQQIGKLILQIAASEGSSVKFLKAVIEQEINGFLSNNKSHKGVLNQSNPPIHSLTSSLTTQSLTNIPITNFSETLSLRSLFTSSSYCSKILSSFFDLHGFEFRKKLLTPLISKLTTPGFEIHLKEEEKKKKILRDYLLKHWMNS